MATADYKGKLEVDIDNDDTWSEVTNTVDATANPTNNSIDSSQLDDAGNRRTQGRADFSVEATVNLDLTLTQHQTLLDRAKDESEIGMRWYPDRNNSQYLEAVGLISDFSLEATGDDVVSGSFTFQNSDGNEWTTSW